MNNSVYSLSFLSPYDELRLYYICLKIIFVFYEQLTKPTKIYWGLHILIPTVYLLKKKMEIIYAYGLYCTVEHYFPFFHTLLPHTVIHSAKFIKLQTFQYH